VNRAFILIASVSLSVIDVGSAVAATTTVTFDDISTSALVDFGLAGLPSPYDGLNWTCVSGCAQAVMNVPGYSSFYSSGYSGALVSSPNIIDTAGFTFSPAAGGDFSFTSAYITGAWRDDLNVAVTGYNGSTVVDSVTLTLGAADTQGFYTFNWDNLTSVTITPSGGTPSATYTLSNGVQIGVDNLTYSTVPLPSSIWLLVSGLGLAGFLLTGGRSGIRTPWTGG